MSVGIQDNKNLGVVKVTITTLPQLHPFSAATNAAQNYICYGLDTKGFQIEIDLQAMPPGVTLSQLQTDQVWWVEKRTSLYRLFLYAGTFDRTKNQVISTAPLPSSAATGGVPAGTLLDFAGPVAPSGYLLCDGSSYSTTTYSGLFNAISYTWGGTGSSFNVPDLRGRTTIGAGSGTGLTFRALATYSGEETHVLVSGETPLVSHTHAFPVPSSTFTVPSYTGSTSTGTSNTVSLNTAGGSTGSGSTGTGTTNSTTTVAGSASISSGNTGSGAANIGASASQSAHSHGITPTAGSFWETGNSTGSYYIGTAVPAGGVQSTRISSESTSSVAPGINVSASDSGHSHSLSGVSVSIPSLTVNGATIPALSIPSLSIASQAVTGSVSIPGLAFTVPAQTGLTTSGNTATTASGHNNMQPYAVVTKIIKY